LTDFNSFWRATPGKNLTQVTVVLATSLLLLHYLVKCRYCSLAIYNN